MGRHGGSRLNHPHLAFLAAAFFSFFSFFFCLRGQTISNERRRSPSGQECCFLGSGSGVPADAFVVARVIRCFCISHSTTSDLWFLLTKMELKASHLMTYSFTFFRRLR